MPLALPACLSITHPLTHIHPLCLSIHLTRFRFSSPLQAALQGGPDARRRLLRSQRLPFVSTTTTTTTAAAAAAAAAAFLPFSSHPRTRSILFYIARSNALLLACFFFTSVRMHSKATATQRSTSCCSIKTERERERERERDAPLQMPTSWSSSPKSSAYCCATSSLNWIKSLRRTVCNLRASPDDECMYRGLPLFTSVPS